jgi:hypothetical protein
MKDKQIEKLRLTVAELNLEYPKRYYFGVNNENCSGDNIKNCKNTFNSFDCHNLENVNNAISANAKPNLHIKIFKKFVIFYLHLKCIL